MGLRVNVYKSSLGDCTNGGITAHVNHLTVVNVDGPFTPTVDAPAAILIDGPGGTPNPILVPSTDDGAPIRPLKDGKPGIGPMHGGNLAESSDSRWNAAVAKIVGGHVGLSAVRVHDRFEDAALNEALSR